MDYKDLERVNNEAKVSPIKDKPYIEVNERVKAFRKLFPTGSILTDMVSNENGVCIFKATVGYEEENGNFRVLATGMAYEKENSTFINKTSYIENAETSAVGRALGLAGYGIDTSIASAEEVANAMENQKSEPKPTPKKEVKKITPSEMGKISLQLVRTGVSEDDICKRYGIRTLTDMTSDIYEKCLKALQATKDREDDSKN